MTPKPDPPPLVCAACGHVSGPRDRFVYRVIDGAEGVWCPSCVPDRDAEARGSEGGAAGSSTRQGED
jgi:hypothetical protein